MQGSPTALGDSRRSSAWLGAALVVLLAAFCFQGSRGIWEPDEGFYTNVAVGMLHSGDWTVPRLNGEPFLDKPPLLYWTMAGAMSLLGVNEWAARAPHALWFAATALVLGALAGRWWGRRAGLLAVLVYASSSAPFLAANVLTPDTPLAFAAALAYYFFWRLEEATDPSRRLRWGALLGVALGLGALAKGPAMLVLAAPLVIHAALRRRSLARLFEPGLGAAAAIALALVLPWYWLVSSRLDGGLEYMIHNQVVGRLFSGDYARNSGPLGGVLVYLPTLLVGALPWSAAWAFRFRRSARIPRRAVWIRLHRRPIPLLVLLWFVVPLVVFVAARSRLPLYVLPLFAPIALATAHGLSRKRPVRGRPARRRALAPAAIATAWLLLLIGVKGGVAFVDHARDARRTARALRQWGIPTTQLLVTVDTKRNGLAFYGYRHLEQVTALPVPYPFFVLPESLTEEVREIRDGEALPLLLVPERRSPAVLRLLAENSIPVRLRSFHRSLSLLELGAAPGPRAAVSPELVPD